MKNTKPILMSGPLVRGLLREVRGERGGKTQTRRLVNQKPHNYGQPGDLLWVRETWGVGSRLDPSGGYDGIEYRADAEFLEKGDDLPCHAVETPNHISLGDYRSGWKPSIHMPRWASRLTLEITNMWVEQLNDISEEDAMAEGCKPWTGALQSYRTDFRYLWESIYGHGSWDENPYVLVIEFKPHLCNVDTFMEAME